jgi:hypothetical protein
MDNSVVAVLFFAILCCGVYYAVRKRPFIEPRSFSWDTPPSVWNNYQPISKTAATITSVYYGKLDLREPPLPIFGTLLIQDNWLLFLQTYRDKTPTVGLPLHEIGWICHQNMSLQERDTLATQEALTLHCVSGNHWGVFTFVSPQAEELARQIQEQTDAHYNSHYVIYGPEEVELRQQNIYGQWSTQQKKAVLYLAPDRLLTNWQSWIELSQIQTLALMPDNILKINYISDQLHMVGIEFSHEQAILWAEYLERATRLTVENLAGRKKKSEAE